LLLFVLLGLNFFFLFKKEVIVTIRHPFKLSEQATSCESGYLGLWVVGSDVLFCLFTHKSSDHCLGNLIGKVPKRGKVSRSEAPLDQVMLFVCEIIKQLSQIRQFVVLGRLIYRDGATCHLALVAELLLGVEVIVGPVVGVAH
jgi:hypothetical protein